MNNIHKYSGNLTIDEYDVLMCGNGYLVELIQTDFNVGDSVLLRYYITSEECTETEAKEALLMNVFGGSIDKLEFVLDAYSEYTIMELEEHLTVGGHNLIEELRTYEGKYLNLTITHKNKAIAEIIKDL